MKPEVVTWDDIEKAADIYGSYDEARRHLAVGPNEVVFEEAETATDLPPIAVSLAERALSLAGIMTYYNADSKLQGLMKQEARRGRTPEQTRMRQNMQTNVNKLSNEYREHIATLVAADALRAHGWEEADIEVQQVAMRASLNRAYGAGHAYARDRHKVVKRARSVA